MREFGRRRWVDWLAGLMVLGIVGSYGKRHSWLDHLRAWLNAGLQMVADPSHLAEVLLGIGIAVVLALWWLPKWQAAGSQGIGVENRFERENEARKTLAQIVAGVFVLAGLYSSVKTFDLQRKSSDLQREGQITDRFTKAIDQLGAMTTGANGKPSPNLEVRLGGIYALERIAKDSPKDHWTIMEVLTAYVRQNAPVMDYAKLAEGKLPKPDAKQTQQVKSPNIHADIQAILEVIGRRAKDRDPEGRLVNLHYTDISNANLNGADLSGANLTGADLSGVGLIAANLRGAYFNRAHLSRADIHEANLVGAHLNSADLRFAVLGEAYLSRADLQVANLDGADLQGTYLDGAILFETKLRGAHLRRADLSGANLEDADLRGADLDGADLSTARSLTQSQVDVAYGDAETKLPPGLTRPASWSK